VLKKPFWDDERKFLEPPMRLAAQQQRSSKINFREIFGDGVEIAGMPM
jgi:hypothetical protein